MIDGHCKLASLSDDVTPGLILGYQNLKKFLSEYLFSYLLFKENRFFFSFYYYKQICYKISKIHFFF